MIEDNTYEENVKDFNRMLFKLDDKDFNWDTHVMIDLIVEQIEAEYTMNCMMDDSNAIHINRFHDVLKWESYQKFVCPGGSIPPISVLEKRSRVVPKKCKQSKPILSERDKVVPTRRGFAIPSGRGFAVGRDGRRKRKKYL